MKEIRFEKTFAEMSLEEVRMAWEAIVCGVMLVSHTERDFCIWCGGAMWMASICGIVSKRIGELVVPEFPAGADVQASLNKIRMAATGMKNIPTLVENYLNWKRKQTMSQMDNEQGYDEVLNKIDEALSKAGAFGGKDGEENGE